MTVNEAIGAWRALQTHVTPSSLSDAAQHELVHSILVVVGDEIRAGRMTYEDFERRVAI